MELADAPQQASLVRRIVRACRRAVVDRAQRRLYLKRIWDALLPWPLPQRLPFGGIWLGSRDVISDRIMAGGHEEVERRLVEALVHPGMTVVDGGAHTGFYTLLLSRRTGRLGKVVAFEPSPRERQRLLRHLRLNRRLNVCVEPFALGSQPGTAQLFVVDGRDTGCNSLRPPDVTEPTYTITVHVAALDDYVRQRGLDRVDFLKLDVEGAEMQVLRGARALLSSPPRPIIMCEAEDRRTIPWGYRAAHIVGYLVSLGYVCYSPAPGPRLVPLDGKVESVNGNIFAVPPERFPSATGLVSPCSQREVLEPGGG